MQCAQRHASRSSRTGYRLSCPSCQTMRSVSGPACAIETGVGVIGGKLTNRWGKIRAADGSRRGARRGPPRAERASAAGARSEPKANVVNMEEARRGPPRAERASAAGARSEPKANAVDRNRRMAKEHVAILGGTGEQGLGLAYRFAKAGRAVRIGSRKEERALEAAKEVLAKLPGSDVSGHENAAAGRALPGGIVILSVPFEH